MELPVEVGMQCDLALAMWLISFKVLLNAKGHHLEWFSKHSTRKYSLKPENYLQNVNV